MKKTLAITIMKFKEMIRTFKSSAIIFVLPVVFIAIFGIAFGSTTTNISFPVGVMSSDEQPYASFVTAVEALNSGSSEQSLFKITEYADHDLAFSDLEKNTIQAVLESREGKLVVTTNPANQQAMAVVNILSSVSAEFQGVHLADYIVAEQIPVAAGQKSDYSAFQFLAAGLIVYGLLILIPQVALDFVKINSKQQIFRYFTSKANALQIIVGNFLYLFIVGVIQLLILYAATTVFGFEPSGQALVALFLIGLPTVAFSIGVGLLIGAYIKNPDAAANLGSMLSVILGFFSGSFINQIDQVLKINIGDFSFSLSQLIPAYHANEAMRSVMLFGNDISEVSTQIAIVGLSSFAILILGIFVFNRRQLQKLG